MTDKINLVEDTSANDADSDVTALLKQSEIPWRSYLADKNYSKDISTMCEECVAEQVREHGSRVIPCTGLADARSRLGDDLYNSLTADMSEEEVTFLEATYDPYKYMDSYIDLENVGKDTRRFQSRWYQERIVRCVQEDTQVLLADNTTKSIKDMVKGDLVVSYDHVTDTVNTNRVVEVYKQGNKELFRITFKDGRYLDVTENHPIYAKLPDITRDYIAINEGLQEGFQTFKLRTGGIMPVHIVSIEQIDVGMTYDIEVENDHSFIANGTIVHNCTATSKVVRMGRRCVASYEQVLMGNYKYKAIKDIKIGDEVITYIGGKPVRKPVTQQWSNGFKEVFRITFDDESKIDCTSNHPILCTEDDKDVWKGIETGLKVGDITTMFDTRTKQFYKTTVKNISSYGELETYDLSIKDSANYIVNNVVTHNTGKTMALAILILHKLLTNTNYRVLLVSPYQVQTEEIIDNLVGLCHLLPEYPITGKKASPTHVLTFNTGSVLKGFTAATDANAVRGQPGDLLVLDECLTGDTSITLANGTTKSLEDIVIGDLVKTFDEVTETFRSKEVTNKKLTGIKEVYEYLYSDGKTLKATTNHPVLTSKGWLDIDKATEVISHTGEVIRLVSKTYLGSKEVYNLTVEDDHNYIANGIITHNCDDIPEKAMISIMGIKLDNADVEIWKSGTPKGEMNLYKAEQESTTKKFHYPSFVIPHYNDSLDKTLRDDLGELGFVQEAIGEFGIIANGVFQVMFITQAQQRSEFIDAKKVLADRSRYIIVIGIDWNHEVVGTRIVVIAYDKLNPQFKVIEKAAVTAIGRTQQAAMETIINLNRKYNADHIFCDQGFGATQIGDLKMVGESAAGTVPRGHPDLKLLDVTGVDFASNTEIRDPVNGEVYKVPTKQFAVTNTVLLLERGLMSLHPKDDNDIIMQMKNYIEKSRSKSRIVYSYISKKIGDHDLDALMIGLYGYRQIYATLFGGSVLQAMIKFVDKADEHYQHPSDQGEFSTLDTNISPHIHLKFSKTPRNNQSRLSKLGGLQSRDRRQFR